MRLSLLQSCRMVSYVQLADVWALPYTFLPMPFYAGQPSFKCIHVHNFFSAILHIWQFVTCHGPRHPIWMADRTDRSFLLI